jgi:hypothetical protein
MGICVRTTITVQAPYFRQNAVHIYVRVARTRVQNAHCFLIAHVVYACVRVVHTKVCLKHNRVCPLCTYDAQLYACQRTGACRLPDDLCRSWPSVATSEGCCSRHATALSPATFGIRGLGRARLFRGAGLPVRVYQYVHVYARTTTTVQVPCCRHDVIHVYLRVAQATVQVMHAVFDRTRRVRTRACSTHKIARAHRFRVCACTQTHGMRLTRVTRSFTLLYRADTRQQTRHAQLHRCRACTPCTHSTRVRMSTIHAAQIV